MGMLNVPHDLKHEVNLFDFVLGKLKELE